MKEYCNITKDLKIIMSQDIRYSRNELFSRVEKHIEENTNVVLFEKMNSMQYRLILEINEVEYSFYIILKNITNAGWEDKPMVKRVQVSNITLNNNNAEIIRSDKAYTVVLGYYNYDDNPIFVGWDAYRYLNHKTVRSCYVTVNVLQATYEKKYHEAVCLKQKIWTFIPEKLELFFKNYAEYINKYYKENDYEIS